MNLDKNMTKIFGIIIAIVFTVIFAFQAEQVLAKHSENDDKPISGPITSPLTSPLCKPGFGYGDKNHCHIGPDKDKDKDHDRDKDKDGDKDNHNKDTHVNNSHHEKED